MHVFATTGVSIDYVDLSLKIRATKKINNDYSWATDENDSHNLAIETLRKTCLKERLPFET